jgi:hypothetical protein
MPIYEKKKKPKSNHYFSKYGGWKIGQGNASTHTLDPPPISISIHQGNVN